MSASTSRKKRRRISVGDTVDDPGAVDESRLAAEQRARLRIDAQLQAAGWLVHDSGSEDLFSGRGVAVREVIMAPGHGRVDYLLRVDKRVVGVIEAKPEGSEPKSRNAVCRRRSPTSAAPGRDSIPQSRASERQDSGGERCD